MAIQLDLPPLTTPRMLSLYRTRVIPISDRIRRLTAAFDLGERHRRHTRSSVIVEGEDGALEVYRNSNSFRWRRTPGPWRPPRVECLVGADEARAAARHFLEARELWVEPRAMRVDDTSVAAARDREGGAPPRVWTAERVVTCTFAIDDTAVLGPGHRTAVTIGAGGQVTEMFRFERTSAGPPVKTRLSDPEGARRHFLEWAARSIAAGEVSPVHEALAYLAVPPREKQRYLIPYYVYRWRPRQGEDRSPLCLIVPAFSRGDIPTSPLDIPPPNDGPNTTQPGGPFDAQEAQEVQDPEDTSPHPPVVGQHPRLADDLRRDPGRAPRRDRDDPAGGGGPGLLGLAPGIHQPGRELLSDPPRR